ncbi:trypsin-like peptidase domain-containing protein [Actinospongicola halichondriae]|uniref:trypsin-like peptidase domain-containing protein n=1 Tax=Actinospongicola halichondriae TaxID=3236844 RepID=UPI003D497016
MTLRSRTAALLAVVAMAAVVALAPTADAAPTWAPAATAAIHPGTQTFTDGAQCTANFVFTDASGAVYIGQAAHCSGTGGQTETDGCDAGTLPVGTPVEVDGASRPGTMVYNSWATMQANGETDANTCAHNDFALIKLHPADHDKVNPSIPVWGGPVGLSGGSAAGSDVYSFGNSGIRAGIEQLSPKYGISLGTDADGWNTPLYTVTPGIPGDSGSAFLDADGRALGVLSTLAIAPLPLSNNVSSIANALSYMRTHDGPQVSLANGTEPFRSGPGGLVTGLLGG